MVVLIGPEPGQFAIRLVRAEHVVRRDARLGFRVVPRLLANAMRAEAAWKQRDVTRRINAARRGRQFLVHDDPALDLDTGSTRKLVGGFDADADDYRIGA